MDNISVQNYQNKDGMLKKLTKNLREHSFVGYILKPKINLK